MSNAVERPRLLLGSCPDSWGVWFADDPLQTPWQRFLDELAEVGYEWLELGPYGYLPTDPSRLREEVETRGLKVSGQTVYGGLHDPDQWSPVLESARQVANLISAVGGRYLVFLPAYYRDERTAQSLAPTEIDQDAWLSLVSSMNRLGKIIREEYDVTLVFHNHADTHVETQAQVERFLDDTDPEHVSLCLDTGHLAYRRGDNAAVIRKYPERIGYVHIKQMDPAVLDVVEKEDLSFGEAVKRGASAEPPNGEPDIGVIAEALKELDRDELFVIVEQDLYPCQFDVPKPIAKRTYDYLRSVGIGSDGR